MDESNGCHTQFGVRPFRPLCASLSFQTAQALAHDSGPALWIG